MIYKKPTREGTPQMKVEYQLIQPIVLKIEKPDGTVNSWSFGIGETFTMMEPTMQFLIRGEKWDKIPLTDGSFIVDYPDELEKVVKRVRESKKENI